MPENPVHEHDEDDYRGAAVVFTEDHEIAVDVVLRGHFQPIDGRFHWYGRVAANERITELTAGRRTQVVLRTPAGEAAGTLSDPDPWNRYRIAGLGRPPFELDTELHEPVGNH
ncbi:uncharacterized protein DUF4873 [Halopolyspora algeriensis]|uniref:Uncharacterized protein DUF4873 n=1 Tax=Halopolyspora algeriensis TaxID=1500506 RepID=A0A368VM79_9ACTN|nr:DUF4873 domain-containing protein [Halopolyspora algeriensis]RCW42821.1 uncharacterized protein DUF4873 [Halopolyspora algeriensis]TQM56709.1 uncharacterized protein DUF4873 [Halopolyspora algeriensis]